MDCSSVDITWPCSVCRQWCSYVVPEKLPSAVHTQQRPSTLCYRPSSSCLFHIAYSHWLARNTVLLSIYIGVDRLRARAFSSLGYAAVTGDHGARHRLPTRPLERAAGQSDKHRPQTTYRSRWRLCHGLTVHSALTIQGSNQQKQPRRSRQRCDGRLLRPGV